LLKPTSDTEFLAYMARVAGVAGDMLTAEGWETFLRDAGLASIVARAHPMDMRREAKDRLKRYTLRDVLAALLRLPVMYLRDPASREFLGETVGGVKHVRKETFEYLGYGVYAGQKAAEGE
jgi:hypothetical protein